MRIHEATQPPLPKLDQEAITHLFRAADENGMIFSVMFDGRGGGKELSWSDFVAEWNNPDLVWLNCDSHGQNTEAWLRTASGASESQADYLLADETRPGCIQSGDSLLIILRAINKNPGEDPDDMVSIRMWMDKDHILTFRVRRVYTLNDILGDIKKGQGPKDSADFLEYLLCNVSTELLDHVLERAEAVSDMEERIISGDVPDTYELARQRLAITRLRKFVLPQIEAVQRIEQSAVSWIHQGYRIGFKNSLERLRRTLDDLDVLHERLRLIQEEMDRTLSETLNRRMYFLAALTAIFLPLNLIASLFGMNVGGIPGSMDSFGFWLIASILLGSGVLSTVIFFVRQLSKTRHEHPPARLKSRKPRKPSREP